MAEAYNPPPDINVDAWAGEHRHLDSKASAEPGRWQNARTPYLIEIMRHLSQRDPTKRIVFMKGSQIGGTEAGNNWIGYIVDVAPGPSLMVTPTVELGKRAMKQRLQPMFDASPTLAQKIGDSAIKLPGGAANTTVMKEFDGGLLMITGSNSAAGLRSMPIKYLFCDEVDAYPGDVDDEGDPVALAEKRTQTFARRKVFLVSTPTIKGLSRIEDEYSKSDQRRYFVPCPHCKNMDWMRWSNIRYEKGHPETATLRCEACDQQIEHRHKTWMMDPANGAEWRATAKGNGTLGYHLSALYSPIGWKSWAECVQEWEDAQGNALKLKTFINTILGETWEEKGVSIEANALMARMEVYAAEVPKAVGALTCAVDVQDDRLECKVKGYAAGEESYLIAYHVIPGDPGQEHAWRELDEFRKITYQHENGGKVGLDVTFIDSGGHHTEEVYKYCATRDRAYACRGGGSLGFVTPPTRSNSYRIPLFTLNTTAGKDIIFSRMLQDGAGPGVMHFPHGLDKEYFDGLTSEKAIRKWVKNKGSVKEYVKTRERNEPLDLENYCLAALYALGPAFIRTLGTRAAGFIARPPAPPPPQQTMTGVPVRPGRSGGWINNY